MSPTVSEAQRRMLSLLMAAWAVLFTQEHQAQFQAWLDQHPEMIAGLSMPPGLALQGGWDLFIGKVIDEMVGGLPE